MDNYFYVVLEIQIDNGGNRGLLNNFYDNLDSALAKLYTVLSAAAVSGIPYHAGQIIRSDGLIIEGRIFDRRTPPVNEPEIEE